MAIENQTVLSQVEPWKAGMREISAGDMNTLIDAIRNLNWEVIDTFRGVVTIPGEITCCGPDGPVSDPDYEDARYWVKIRAFCSNDSDSDATDAIEYTVVSETVGTEDNPFFEIVTATNKAEKMLDEGHYLKEGQPIDLYFDIDQGDPPRIRWFFTMMPLVLCCFLGGMHNAHGSIPADGMKTMNNLRWTEDYEHDPQTEFSADFKDFCWYQDILYAVGTFTWNPGDPSETNSCLAYWNPDTVKWVRIPDTGWIPDDNMGLIVTGRGFNPTVLLGWGNAVSGNYVWTFDGTTWSSLSPQPPGGTLPKCACLWDGILFMGLTLSYNPGVIKWHGTGWDLLPNMPGGGGSTGIMALCVHDDGLGEMLYAGGENFTNKIQRIKADLIAWEACGDELGLATGSYVAALCEYDDGNGLQLFAGGYLISNDNHDQILRGWTGQYWVDKGYPIINVMSGADPVILTLAVHGADLACAGIFHVRKHPVGPTIGNNIVEYDRGNSEFDTKGRGVNGTVRAIEYHNGEMFIGGNFLKSGRKSVEYAAKYNETLGYFERLDSRYAFGDAIYSIHDWSAGAFSPNHLYLGGDFLSVGPHAGNRVIRYDADGFDEVALFDDRVNTICQLGLGIGSGYGIFGGRFTHVMGSVRQCLCRLFWNIPTQSYILDPNTDIEFTCNTGEPEVTCSYYDDSASRLYVAGRFDIANGVTVNNIFYMVPPFSTPIALGALGSEGVGGVVNSMAMFTSGLYGKELWVGGVFSTVGGGGTPAAMSVGRWNVVTAIWAAGPNRWNPPVGALTVHDDGSGSKLFIAGRDVGFDDYDKVHEWDGVSSGSWAEIAASQELIGHVLTMKGEPSNGPLQIGGAFALKGTVTNTVDMPESLIYRHTKSGTKHLAGGIGTNPNRGPLQLDPGSVLKVRSLPDPLHRCDSLFTGGRFGLVNAGYSPSVTAVSQRQMHNVQGGLISNSGFYNCYCVYRRSRAEIYFGGEWQYAHNLYVNTADVGTIDEYVNCPNIIRYQDGYFKALGSGAPGRIGRNGITWFSIIDELCACHNFTAEGPRRYNEGTETWSFIHSDFETGIYEGIVEFEDKLFVGGYYNILTVGTHLAHWDGSNPPVRVAGIIATHLQWIESMLKCDMGSGEDIYFSGQTQIGGCPVLRYNGGTPTTVGASTIRGDVVTSLGYLTFIEGITTEQYLVAVGVIEVFHDGGWDNVMVAYWDGSNWNPLVETGYAFEQANGCAGVRELNISKEGIIIMGDFGNSISDVDDVGRISPNVAEWKPRGGNLIVTGMGQGGLNGWSLSVG